jgi:hypothetical protein
VQGCSTLQKVYLKVIKSSEKIITFTLLLNFRSTEVLVRANVPRNSDVANAAIML